VLLGRTEPRLWTPPLRDLTPDTSLGWEVIEFAALIGRPLDPWQAWLVIHGMELLPDGRPRFRQLLVLVARQNGKTELLVILTLWWLFVERVGMVLSTSTKLDYARESWMKAVRLAQNTPMLAAEIPRSGVRKANGEQELGTVWGGRYKIGASNEEGGRSLTVDRLVEDELRQHHDWSAHEAAENAMNAVPDAQAWAITNQGDDRAVVLDSLRAAALDYLATGIGDHRLGLFEWSAPDGADVTDLTGQAQANPNLGHRIDPDALAGKALRARVAGGEQEAKFRVEVLCQRVRLLDPAIDPAGWLACLDPGDLSSARSRIALCVDVSLDLAHATLAAAAVLADGRVRVEVIGAWGGPHCTTALVGALPGWVAKVRPRVLGWIPGGPAASVAADLADRKDVTAWPPPGVKVEDIRGEVTAVCMGLAQLVTAAGIAHSGDPLIDAHVAATEKLWQGDTWRFNRKGGHCDAAYAVAGAVHLARTLPTSVGKPRVITAT
jgi:hypothetical protein